MVVIIVMDYVSFTILAPGHLEKGKLETSIRYGIPHVHEIVMLSLEKEVKTVLKHSWCLWSVFETFPVNPLQLSS
jgi:hypothetical protein